MGTTIDIAASVREQLRRAMVDETILVEAVESADRSPLDGAGERLRCRPILPVPRPLDPETAELRRLEIVLEPVADGMRIVSIDGLDSGDTV